MPITAAGDKFRQAPAVGASQRAWFRPDAFGEQGVDLGVECIGLSKAPDGTGKVPDLARIDHGERQIGAGQSGSDDDFISAGGFEHD